jgi:small subunit ribosomal protein S8
MNTDPIADMLTRIRNGCGARMGKVQMPSSKLKVKIAEILKAEGYIEDFTETDGRVAKELQVGLRYDKRGSAVIEGIQRVSKPGLRLYFRSKEIPKVRGGLGVMILSTSHGVMTDRSARKANVGGEPICSVW